MGDFDRKKYESMMEEVITDPEIRNVILDGFKGQQFNCPDTAYAVAAGVVEKICSCSGVKGLSFNDRYVLLFTQISNLDELMIFDCNKPFTEYIQMILNIVSRALAIGLVYDKGYRTFTDDRGFSLYLKES